MRQVATRLLDSDVKLIARLLEDPEEWEDSPTNFSRKILRALYDNDSVASINATRGIIVVHGGPGATWGLGPYPTVAAAHAAVRSRDFPGFSGTEKLYAMHLTHPDRYAEKKEELPSARRIKQVPPRVRRLKAAA